MSWLKYIISPNLKSSECRVEVVSNLSDVSGLVTWSSIIAEDACGDTLGDVCFSRVSAVLPTTVSEGALSDKLLLEDLGTAGEILPTEADGHTSSSSIDGAGGILDWLDWGETLWETGCLSIDGAEGILGRLDSPTWAVDADTNFGTYCIHFTLEVLPIFYLKHFLLVAY